MKPSMKARNQIKERLEIAFRGYEVVEIPLLLLKFQRYSDLESIYEVNISQFEEPIIIIVENYMVVDGTYRCNVLEFYGFEVVPCLCYPISTVEERISVIVSHNKENG